MAAIRPRPLFETPAPTKHDPVPSSSPAFATPVHPLRPHPTTALLPATSSSRAAPILPILLPPATLRPIAFRTFTKKHNLTLTSSALQALASFIGKHCGSGWREEGLAELVLEEVARQWKKCDAKVIVDAEGTALQGILKTLEVGMSGGRIVVGKGERGLTRQGSLVWLEAGGRGGMERQESFGMSALGVEDAEEEEQEEERDPRSWLKVVSAFEQPKMMFNASRKHFEKSKTVSTFFPPPSHKTELFRQRYHLVHQRVLRNDSFQSTSLSRQNSTTSGVQQEWKITPIANLLGRSGSGHLLLGLLTVAPTGTLAINDLTGSIFLDLEQAAPIDQVETWLCPGMIVLVDGIYEEEYNSAGGSLGNSGGIGGTIGGRFIGFSIGAPRCETRTVTLGVSDGGGDLNAIGGGFGWVDFLGLGSERAVGSRMRRLEQRLLNHNAIHRNNSNKIVIVGEVNLDNPKTLEALRVILKTYTTTNADSATPIIPLAFILMGNFVHRAAMAGSTTATSASGSIEYKEHFDALAALLSDFPSLLRSATFIFVPGDNDPWPSAFSAGAATPLPRKGVPELFTSRVKRAFAVANAETRTASTKRPPGEAVWTTNPSRVSLFGPSHEIVLFRDDMSGRLRRSAIALKSREGADEANAPVDASAQVPATATGVPTPATDVDVDADLEPMEIEPSPAVPLPSSPPPPLQPTTTTTTNNPPPALPPTSTVLHARRLVKTILDQSHLSPFPLSTRPVHWDFAHALSLYPLPTALVLCDAEAPPFAVTYQGCHVVNPGRVVEAGGRGRGVCRWVEYDGVGRRGVVRECGRGEGVVVLVVRGGGAEETLEEF